MIYLRHWLTALVSGKWKRNWRFIASLYRPWKILPNCKTCCPNQKRKRCACKFLNWNNQKHLEENGINATIYGRAKHYYSIYNKMKRLNVSFDQLYDITAIRVIVDDEKDCYNALGIIHSQFKPIPGRFKDYIAMPKGNMYRSLHTSVIGLKTNPLKFK